MKLTGLKLTGFKSFVETTEVPINPGLTGVVGPNGCGKSNLVEALRWVMGESSFKNMRASAMDDVIFAGSGERPARNMAEVALIIDNTGRTAPAAFNDADRLEVTRRIAREDGSTYRVNGKEVRAKDVQLLFADAATGARSPALVRQGQISEIISAKPQSRRRLLEDAAGIAGLHSRRHEAELRLRAAEDNLLRLEDVLREIMAQTESLARQAKQATRYRGLAAEIRKAEALQALIARKQAQGQAMEAQASHEASIRDLADVTRTQGEAVRLQAVAAAAIPALREREVAAAAALVRLKRGLDELEADERRRAARAGELDKRLAELAADMARGEQMAADAEASLARLDAEQKTLASESTGSLAASAAAAEAVVKAETALADAEKAVADLQAQRADITARAAALQRGQQDAQARAARLRAEAGSLAAQLGTLDAASQQQGGSADELRTRLADTQAAAVAADAEAAAARAALARAREAEQASRQPLNEAERTSQRIDTEIRTLKKLLSVGAGDLWPSMLDAVTAAKGYETALGAALGDDLDASTNASAPAHWQTIAAETSGGGDGPLPAGCESLASFVRAPESLQRRLKQIGVVARNEGAALRSRLQPGQRLVSREGDLWRWDGYTAAAEAPSAAARRLAEKNRLGDLEREAQGAHEAAEIAREAADAALALVRQATQADNEANAALGQTRRAADMAREALAQAERKLADTASRRAGLVAAIERLAASQAEAEQMLAAAVSALDGLSDTSGLDNALLAARALLGEARAKASDVRAAKQGLEREAEQRHKRLAVIAGEITAWTARIAASESARTESLQRHAAATAEKLALADAPDQFLVRRREIIAEIERAEAARKGAADRLAEAETAQAVADRAAREALDQLSLARERRAVAQTRLEAAGQRLADVERMIAEQLEVSLAELDGLAGHRPGDELPDPAGIERRVAGLKAERERLGAVNLRAEQELGEAIAKHEGLVSERDDLTEAIRRLRQAIGALNREGRERLLAAFEVVDGHFRRLFGVLFGGGEAELRLVDAEDPLEAGLEIFARPPGKKPQVMTLLSGGEQALTATALIFAVFLTNPSPICVLDEVDAPLDDANVERYCDLLRNMVGETETRFVVITHNPITMARMDRLFGVTMAERGVSQLVTVDLETAEQLAEAS